MGCWHLETSIKDKRERPTLDALVTKLTDLQIAQADSDALNVDHEYRLTLLELGLGEEV